MRDVVAAAAALARPTESLLGDSLALEQAAEAGIVEVADGEVRFTHPLLALRRLRIDPGRGSMPPCTAGSPKP